MLDPNKEIPIKSLPGISRFGINVLIEHLKPIVENGLKSVLLFPVMEESSLSHATSELMNPVIASIPFLKKAFPELVVIVDVCLCAFTGNYFNRFNLICLTNFFVYLENGHCCVFNKNGTIDNLKSIELIAKISVAYAKAGADMIAPSDMNDRRIASIKYALHLEKLNNVAVMSYSAKFASCLYGPFREAARSSPSAGTDRSQYQLPIGSSGLALQAADRDIKEGADFLMVKPGIFYLDIIRQIADKYPNIPLAVYQVSGEYSMIYQGWKVGLYNLDNIVMESVNAFKRAGASIIISYFTPQILAWLVNKA